MQTFYHRADPHLLKRSFVDAQVCWPIMHVEEAWQSVSAVEPITNRIRDPFTIFIVFRVAEEDLDLREVGFEYHLFFDMMIEVFEIVTQHPAELVGEFADQPSLSLVGGTGLLVPAQYIFFNKIRENP